MLLFFFLLGPSAQAILFKREVLPEIVGDGYGDEPFTPAYKVVAYKEEREIVKHLNNAKEPMRDSLFITPSGYRKKRSQNSYGDESVTPSGEAGYEPEVEETDVPVDNGYETEIPEVYPSGYRRKRAGENSYGDEQVTPSGFEEYKAVTEETAVPVYNEGYSEKAPAVYAAGYRKKL